MLQKLRTLYRAYLLLSSSPLFDKDYYAAAYHVPRFLAVLHYILLGKKLGTNPSEEFNAERYLKNYPDVGASRQPALYHYLTAGQREGRIYENTSEELARCPMLKLFDGAWYARTYLNGKTPAAGSLMHYYLTEGWQKKHLPFPLFDAKRFADENPACREEPLQYWYRHRLPGLYITDPYALAYGNGSAVKNTAELAVHYWQNSRIDAYLSSQGTHTDLQLMLAPTPDDASAGTLAAFQKRYRQALQEGNGTVLAVTCPGQRCITGQGIFPADMPIFRYSQLQNRICHFERIAVTVFDYRVGALIDFLRFNTDDILLHGKSVSITILNTQQTGDMSLRKAVLKSWFSRVTEEDLLIHEPGDCPIFGLFDADWYRKTYLAGTEQEAAEPKDHYLTIGWREHLAPFRYFAIDRFYAEHPECDMEPLFYIYENKIPEYYFTEKAIPQMGLNQRAGVALQMYYRMRQEQLIEKDLPYDNQVEKLMILMVSPEDAISGGIMSFYGIYHYSRQMEKLHHRKVITVSIPGDTTHAGFTMFSNDMPVYRYDMVIRRMGSVKDVLIMVPETYVEHYLQYLRNNSDDPVLNAPVRHFNILNQKIEIMPEPPVLRELETYFPNLTQTVAHYKYCTQKERDYYDIPQHLLLPPIIKNFTLVPYEKKEPIFAYSYDEAPWKEKMLGILQKEFPELRFVEIKGLMFDEYLALIHRAKWCMTFGEGLDGYFSEPYQAGGISFAVWNDEYFTERYHHLPTVLDSIEDAWSRLPELMRSLDNKKAYEAASTKVRNVHNEEYAGERTSEDQLRDFFLGRYDFP